MFIEMPLRRARLGTATVAQGSKSAVSRVSKPAGRVSSSALPTWKSATSPQSLRAAQIWKPAVPAATFRRLAALPNYARLPLMLALASLLIGAASSAWGQSIGVSFIGRNASPADNLAPTDVAGVVGQPNWNNIDSGGTFSGTTAPLADSSGNVTGVTLTYNADDSWDSDGGTATPDERLMKGIIKANPHGATSPPAFTTMTFVFNSVPAGSYDVYVYAMENLTGAKISVNVGTTTYYIAEENIFNDQFIQATSTTLNSYQDANYALFSSLSPASDGTLMITATKYLDNPQLNDGAGVAGIQLVPSGTPIAPRITTPLKQWFNEGPVTVRLTATAKDDGLPLPANPSNPDPNDPNKLRWGWTVLSTPLASSGVVWSGNTNSGEAFSYQGSPNPPWTVFTCNPTATFDVPGMYLLNFFAFDGQLGSTNQIKVFVKSTGVYRQLGYQYLSPIPGSEYCSPQTRFVLVRFTNISPAAVTNLSFIKVTGASSGNHPGQTHIASDNRTVIFAMSTDFVPYEIVTVSLAPGVGGGEATVAPYQYQFVVSGHMPDPPLIMARGDNPPNQTANKAFDGNASTEWRDLVVPDGINNFSWIQYVYPDAGGHVVTQYAVTSAMDHPERDPADWNLYGVDGAGNLAWLDSQTGQTFANRQQTNIYSFSNVLAYRGYRFEITRVNDPASADSVAVAELGFIPASGSLLREYWLNISGVAVSDLTGNPNYPATSSGSSQLASFEAPTDWAYNNGERVRGYITAPATGSYVFWIASDDASQLWLSTDSTPANKVQIAYVAAWTPPRQWNEYASQQSVPIMLTAGQMYYVEALHKQGPGGENLAVGWAKPGQPTAAPSEVIPGEVLSPWTGGPVSVATVSQTVPSAVSEGGARPSSAPKQTSAPSTWSQPGALRTGAPDRRERVAAGMTSLGANPLAPSPQIRSGGQRHPLATTMANGVSVPSDFPFINITTSTTNADRDPIFLDNRGGGGHPYNVIFDNSGSPIWYSRYPDERRDMKVQPNGLMTMLARDNGNHFDGFNTNYQQITSYWASNGYGVDEHELLVLKDGTYLLIALQTLTVDMSRYVAGGNPAASVTEQVIQQFTPQGELIFQWRAWDQFDIRDQGNFIDNTGSGFDFPHMNSLDLDSDGHILLSSRSTSECTKINRDTGQFIWRLGGAHSDFAFVNDPLNGPRNQHSLRLAGTNNCATVVWQYPATPTPSIYSFYMGDVERLTNGNTLINWAVGSLPKLTEVRPDGTKAYEMNWVNQWEAYRVWRCPWHGVALQPYLILEPYPDNLTLIFNQFGDTNVAYYRIYGGTSPRPTTLLAESGATLKQLSNLQNGVWYFRVTAVNKNGVEGLFSNEATVTVNIIEPGQNMVQNGDFSQGTNLWTFTVSGTASATWAIESGASHIYITNGGATLPSIQLLQPGKALIQGKTYVLQFDAWAAQSRYLDVKLAQSISPFTDYSRITSPFLTPNRTHYRYVFTMQQVSDFSANLLFNLGASSAGVYLANISLFNPPVGDLNQDGRVDFLDLGILGGSWLKQQTGLPADLDVSGQVDFKDFGILGENWLTGWH